MKHAYVALSLATILIAPGTLAAQDSLVDTHVRFTAAAYRDTRVAVLADLKVRTGTRAELGAGIGGLLGAGVGLAIANSMLQRDTCSILDGGCIAWTTYDLLATRLPVLVAGAAAGMVAGALLGGVIGSRIPTWGPANGAHVAPDISVNHGRPSIGLSVAF